MENATWFACTFGAIFSAGFALYSFLPRVFMNWLFLIVSYTIPLLSTSAIAAVLSWLEFGTKLASVFDNKEDPFISAIACK